MKLKKLKPILYSNRGSCQFAIVYDSEANADIENGCTVDYAIEKYGEKECKRLFAFENQIVIVI